MKLIKGLVVISEVLGCGKLPNDFPRPVTQDILDVSTKESDTSLVAKKDEVERYASDGIIDKWSGETISPASEDHWYPLNDGVMGGLSKGSAKWYSLNDGVMGGVSSGSAVQQQDYLIYKGQLSLENNGGFSQVRMDIVDDKECF